MASINSRTGVAVLTLANVAGLLDMVALPLWIGGLMRSYGYAAPQAGLTVTCFLVAVAAASLWLAPRFHRLPGWMKSHLGFALGAVAFAIAATRPVGTEGMALMMALHSIAGLGVGCGLSMTHGCIGLSANPHRLFAMANVALGAFAIVFLAGMPQLIERFGPPTLFAAFSAVFALTALVTFVAFPQERGQAARAAAQGRRLPGAVWLVGGTVVCLTLNQAMMFSFLERIGAARGFGPERIQFVLVAIGLVNLLPGALAGLLQRRLSPLAVGIAGPLAQGALALLMSSSAAFGGYAFAALLYTSAVIFTHTFLIGLLSRLDPSGRVVAATPAMVMLGSCTGPAIGGAVVHTLGYPGLGWVAAGVAAVGISAMSIARMKLRQGSPALAPAASSA